MVDKQADVRTLAAPNIDALKSPLAQAKASPVLD